MSSDNDQPVVKTRKRKRWYHRLRMALLYLLIFVLAGVAFVYFVLLSPARVAAVSRNMLEQMTGAEVSIGSAHLSWGGTLDLVDVKMRARGMTGEGAEIFSADRVQMSCDRSALMRFKLVLKELRIESPVLTLAEDVSTGKLNWDQLMARQMPGGKEAMNLPRALVSDGEFRYGVVEGEKLRVVGTLAISGRIEPQRGKPGRLAVMVWEGSDAQGREMVEQDAAKPQAAGESGKGLRLAGWFDARKHEGQLELSGLAFDERYRRLLPTVAGAVWDDMEPQGEFPKVMVQLSPDKGWTATLGFEHVAMSLPQFADQSDYRIRMTDVSGVLGFEQNQIKIQKELVGKIEGLEYHIAGTIDGYSADSPFRLGMTTEPFVIPDRAQVIYAMPEPVQKVFRMLTPAGRVRVSMTVWRDKAGAQIDYQGTATLLSAKIKYAKFPYEWEDCRGVLKFDRSQVKVLSVTAQGADGVTATATGKIAPLSEDPGVDLQVTALNVPMNQALYEAMPERHQPALDLFFNKPSYERLLKEGHFITAAQYNAEEMAASEVRHQMRDVDEKEEPDKYGELKKQLAQIMKRLDIKEFDLGGRANVQVHVMREEGPGDKTNADADVDLQEASICFRHFPYPMRITSGKLLIRSGRLEFVDWQLVGLHGGTGGLSGTVKLAHGESEDIEPDLKVYMVGLPLDELLMDVLPQPQDRWVRVLNPSGTINVVGRIFAGDDHEPDIDLLIELADGKLSPGSGEYALGDVKGRIRLSLHHVELDHLSGTHDDSTLDVTGIADWTDQNHVKVSLEAEAKKLKFEEPVWELFEPYMKGMMTQAAAGDGDAKPQAAEDDWTEQLRKHEVKGVYDAGLAYETDGKGAQKLKLRVEPNSLSMKMDERAIALTRMHGNVTTDGKTVTLDKLGGQIADAGGKVELSGRLKWAEEEEAKRNVDDGNATTAKPQAAGGGTAALTAGMMGELTLDASGDRMTPTMRGLLPASVAQLVETLKIDGKYAVKLDKLHVNGGAKTGQPRMEVSGTVQLTGGQCDVGVAIEKIDGKVTVDAKQIVGQEWPTLKIDLDAERMVIADRPIEKLHATMSSADEGRLLVVPSLRGALYDGAVGGNGRLGLDDQTYQFHLALSDVDLATFIDKGAAAANAASTIKPGEEEGGKEGKADAQEKTTMKGQLSAAFDVEGKWSQAGSMRGRGDILIRDGVMYDLPLALGLLQVAHLSLPLDRSFDRATISYYLQNGKMRFERLVLQSPHMRLAGGGTMDLKDRKLDISLTSDNPGGLQLGPVTDLINGLRNQFITIRVTGTLDKPDTQVKQFTGFTDAWKDVFGTPEEQNN